MAKGRDDFEGSIGSVPRCQACGSECVVCDAWVNWNAQYAQWDLENVLGTAFCKTCGNATTLVWTHPDRPPNLRIRELNDRFRQKGMGHGSVFLTDGVHAQGVIFVLKAIAAVRNFDNFTDENDPWGEHDFGAIELGGEKVFFKLDYLDPSLEHGSEDAANEGLTHRVLTIMLASEY